MKKIPDDYKEMPTCFLIDKRNLLKSKAQECQSLVALINRELKQRAKVDLKNQKPKTTEY